MFNPLSKRRRTVVASASAVLLAGGVVAGVALAGAANAATTQAPTVNAAGTFENSPIGFGAGTTGGAGGTTVTVTTIGALTTEAKSTGKKVIQVSGIIRGTTEIYVTSDKTIIGIGSNSGLTGAGFFVKKAHNVIIRNLKISFSPAPVDLIQVQKSDHVWVDHNELFNDTNHDKDYYDGMVDINHGSNAVTVSWNKLHDHFKGSLVGHSDKNGTEDKAITVTYHHNWFDNVGSRLPRVRFGTVHIFNNFYSNASTSGIHCLMGAQCLVQNSVFRNVTLPIWTTQDSPQDGYAVENGNDFGGSTPVITQKGSFTKPPYAYPMDATSTVVSRVQAGSGTGKVG